MLKGRDSSTPPTAAQLSKFYAAGVRVWGGYAPGPNILHGWTDANFALVRNAGMRGIAFASGLADPAAMKAWAEKAGVLGCLDVESGIRADGPWVQGWLDTSGFGLYGNGPVHSGRKAPFHVLAAYPQSGVQTAVWDTTFASRPPGPVAWQWEGTHAENGLGVDSGNYDDWFAPTFKVVYTVGGKQYKLLTTAILALRKEAAADAKLLGRKGGKPMVEKITVSVK